MLYKFFSAQWSHPSENDWTTQARQDLVDFGLEPDLNLIKSKSKWSFKTLIKIKAKEFALCFLLDKKDTHSKLKNLNYRDLNMQDYLKELSTNEAQAVFAHRTRMSQYSENYRGGQGHLPCPLCLFHLDCQSMSFNCPIVKQNVKIQGEYKDIFSENIKPELANTIIEIEKFRIRFMESRRIE